MALDTVSEYVAEARTLLQDTVEDYRYSDADLVSALNMAVLEARRLRPDLFLTTFSSLPDFDANDSTAVNIDHQYRLVFVYFMCGYVQLRDEEDTSDSRAGAFFAMFSSKLLGLG